MALCNDVLFLLLHFCAVNWTLVLSNCQWWYLICISCCVTKNWWPWACVEVLKLCFLCSKIKVNQGASYIWGQFVQYYIIYCYGSVFVFAGDYSGNLTKIIHVSSHLMSCTKPNTARHTKSYHKTVQTSNQTWFLWSSMLHSFATKHAKVHGLIWNGLSLHRPSIRDGRPRSNQSHPEAL